MASCFTPARATPEAAAATAASTAIGARSRETAVLSIGSCRSPPGSGRSPGDDERPADELAGCVLGFERLAVPAPPLSPVPRDDMAASGVRQWAVDLDLEIRFAAVRGIARLDRAEFEDQGMAACDDTLLARPVREPETAEECYRGTAEVQRAPGELRCAARARRSQIPRTCRGCCEGDNDRCCSACRSKSFDRHYPADLPSHICLVSIPYGYHRNVTMRVCQALLGHTPRASF